MPRSRALYELSGDRAQANRMTRRGRRIVESLAATLQSHRLGAISKSERRRNCSARWQLHQQGQRSSTANGFGGVSSRTVVAAPGQWQSSQEQCHAVSERVDCNPM